MSFANSPKPEYFGDGMLKERKSKRHLIFRIVGIIIFVTGLGINIYVWQAGDATNEIRGTNGAVAGVVLNADSQPLANAIVFLASFPDKTAATDADGRFTINSLPTGEQEIIVVYDEIGQAFPVTLQSRAVTDIGIINYTVPPEVFDEYIDES